MRVTLEGLVVWNPSGCGLTSMVLADEGRLESLPAVQGAKLLVIRCEPVLKRPLLSCSAPACKLQERFMWGCAKLDSLSGRLFWPQMCRIPRIAPQFWKPPFTGLLLRNLN